MTTQTDTTTATAPATELADRYYIRAKYFFYYGTFNAPEDGPICDYEGSRLEFSSRNEAIEYLRQEKGCREHRPGKFSPAGRYYLSHGEYSSPTFMVQKVPGRKIKN